MTLLRNRDILKMRVPEAQSLWDMMDVPEYMEPYINNWNCRIIQVRSYNREFFKDPEVYSFFEACQQLYRVKGDLSALKGIRLTEEAVLRELERRNGSAGLSEFDF